MSTVVEKSLIVRRESKFDIIRNSLLKLFWGKDYDLFYKMNNLLRQRRPNTSQIVIPGRKDF